MMTGSKEASRVLDLPQVVPDHDRTIRRTSESLSKFQFFNQLPLELRLLILSYTNLSPSLDDRFQWIIDKGQWVEGDWHCRRSCHFFADNTCCCKMKGNSSGSSCFCGYGFYSLLMVSRQFRDESLITLFSNDFRFLMYEGSQGFNSVKKFLGWPPSKSHIRFMKNIEFGLSILEYWQFCGDPDKFHVELYGLLKEFASHSTSLTLLSLSPGGVLSDGIYHEVWYEKSEDPLFDFENKLCDIVDEITRSYLDGCRFCINWGTEKEGNYWSFDRWWGTGHLENRGSSLLVETKPGSGRWQKDSWVKT